MEPKWHENLWFSVPVAVFLWLAMCAALLGLSGCTSSGLVLGPMSAIKRAQNVSSMEKRERFSQILRSEASAEKKLLAVQAVNLGSDEGVAVGLGFNLAPIARQEFTSAEIAEQTGYALLDLGALVAAGKWAYDKWIDVSDNKGETETAKPATSARGNMQTTLSVSGNAVVNYTVYYAGDDSAGGEGGIRQ